MKIKVSISMEKDVYEDVKNKVAKSIYRNKSHLIEHAVELLLRGNKDG